MRIGVVGVGYWGPNLVRTLMESNRCAEVWCFDQRPAAAARIAVRFPTVKRAASLEELISNCDAVMVATPVETHFAVAKAALLKGKPVFVEKPLAHSTQQARELVFLAEQRQAMLMVGHTFIFSPAVRKIKQYVDSGTLGEIYFLSSSRVNLGIHRKDVNVVWDLAAHDLSIFHYWLGMTPKRIAAMGRACIGNMVDVASLHCEFPADIIASLEVSWLAPGKLRRTVVIGSKRMVVYDDTLIDEKIKLLDRGARLEDPVSFGEYQLTYRTGDILSPNLDATEPLLLQTTHFLDCVRTGSRPETDGRMGLEVVSALEAACRSIERNGDWVELDVSMDSQKTGQELIGQRATSQASA